jgi:hypothetical protein
MPADKPITNARILLGLDGFGPVTIEDWRSLGPSVARALIAATDDVDRLTGEVKRLNAELDEARAELANERGEGKPPVEGWLWDPSFKQWELVVDGKGVGFVSRGYQTRWAWEVHVGRRSFHGYAPTARAAIRGTT